jgi:hypothetical protein
MFKNLYVIIFVILVSLSISGKAIEVMAKTPLPSPTPIPTATTISTPTPQGILDLTQKLPITLGPLEAILARQTLGPVWPKNPIKYAIRGAISAGVPANTIVLLLLLPVIATIIAAARHLVGLRGFGIFFPAALAVVFVAIGPILGIGLFLVIVLISTTLRMILRKTKIRLQYLPRMALMIWFVALGVLGILFLAPAINWAYLSNVSIFPVLILALLAEDFTRVQLGKSAKIAINLSIETLILALVSFIFLTLLPVQQFALLNPEILLLGVFIIDFVLGKYIGLRLLEYWRFRKLIRS